MKKHFSILICFLLVLTLCLPFVSCTAQEAGDHETTGTASDEGVQSEEAGGELGHPPVLHNGGIELAESLFNADLGGVDWEMYMLEEGYILFDSNGSPIYVQDNGRFSLVRNLGEENIFDGLESGDRVGVMRLIGIDESYPSVCSIRYCAKMYDGDTANIPADVVRELNGFGYRFDFEPSFSEEETEDGTTDCGNMVWPDSLTIEEIADLLNSGHGAPLKLLGEVTEQQIAEWAIAELEGGGYLLEIQEILCAELVDGGCEEIIYKYRVTVTGYPDAPRQDGTLYVTGIAFYGNDSIMHCSSFTDHGRIQSVFEELGFYVTGMGSDIVTAEQGDVKVRFVSNGKDSYSEIIINEAAPSSEKGTFERAPAEVFQADLTNVDWEHYMVDEGYVFVDDHGLCFFLSRDHGYYREEPYNDWFAMGSTSDPLFAGLSTGDLVAVIRNRVTLTTYPGQCDVTHCVKLADGDLGNIPGAIFRGLADLGYLFDIDPKAFESDRAIITYLNSQSKDLPFDLLTRVTEADLEKYAACFSNRGYMLDANGHNTPTVFQGCEPAALIGYASGWPNRVAQELYVTCVVSGNEATEIFGCSFNSSAEEIWTAFEKNGYTVTEVGRTVSATRGGVTVSFVLGGYVTLSVDVKNPQGGILDGTVNAATLFGLDVTELNETGYMLDEGYLLLDVNGRPMFIHDSGEASYLEFTSDGNTDALEGLQSGCRIAVWRKKTLRGEYPSQCFVKYAAKLYDENPRNVPGISKSIGKLARFGFKFNLSYQIPLDHVKDIFSCDTAKLAPAEYTVQYGYILFNAEGRPLFVPLNGGACFTLGSVGSPYVFVGLENGDCVAILRQTYTYPYAKPALLCVKDCVKLFDGDLGNIPRTTVLKLTELGNRFDEEICDYYDVPKQPAQDQGEQDTIEEESTVVEEYTTPPYDPTYSGGDTAYATECYTEKVTEMYTEEDTEAVIEQISYPAVSESDLAIAKALNKRLYTEAGVNLLQKTTLVQLDACCAERLSDGRYSYCMESIVCVDYEDGTSEELRYLYTVTASPKSDGYYITEIRCTNANDSLLSCTYQSRFEDIRSAFEPHGFDVKQIDNRTVVASQGGISVIFSYDGQEGSLTLSVE